MFRAADTPTECTDDQPPMPPSGAWQDWHLLDDISHLALGAMYLALLVASVYMRLRKAQNLRLFWQRTFFVALVLGILMRGTWCVLQPFVLESMMDLPNILNLVLQTLPSFLFFSCYLIVLFMWAEIYHNVYDPSGVEMTRLRPIYIGSQVAMYIIIVVLELIDRFKFASMGTCPKPDIHTPIQKAIWFFDAALYAFSALGFLIYGGRFYYKFSRERKPLLAKMRMSVLPKVKYLTLMLSVCFLIRGGMTFSNGITNWTNGFWWLDFVYYSVLEVLPIFLMLKILRPTTQAVASQDPINSNHDSWNPSEADSQEYA